MNTFLITIFDSLQSLNDSTTIVLVWRLNMLRISFDSYCWMKTIYTIVFSKHINILINQHKWWRSHSFEKSSPAFQKKHSVMRFKFITHFYLILNGWFWINQKTYYALRSSSWIRMRIAFAPHQTWRMIRVKLWGSATQSHQNQ